MDGGSPNNQKSFSGCGCDPADRAERDLKYDQGKGDVKGLPGSGSEIYPVDIIKIKGGGWQRDRMRSQAVTLMMHNNIQSSWVNHCKLVLFECPTSMYRA